MGNKLKEVFSDQEISIGAKINFKDHGAYKKFAEALEKVQEDGELVWINGVESVETSVKNGDSVYPISEAERIIDFAVGPSYEEVSFDVDTEYGKKVFVLNRYYINKGVILRNSEHSVVFLKFVFDKESEKVKITYKAQPEKAKSISELLEVYSIVLAFLNRLFSKDDIKSEEDISIKMIKDYFGHAITGYRKLEYVAQELGITFEPKDIVESEECWLDLEEIYLSLKEKKTIRLNAKVNETESQGMTVNQPKESIEVGTALSLTFVNNITYSLWGINVTLYAANLLSNAIVKEINWITDDEVKIVYGDEDSRPMYISYRAFKTEEEAEDEMRHIMENREEYENALTVGGYISQRNEMDEL